MVNINPLELCGNWDKGYALDLQTLSSEYIGDDEYGHPHFDTKRSEAGELVFRLKYRADKSVIGPIVTTIVTFLENRWKLDSIVAVPPSNLSRNYQPVTEITKDLSKRLNIPVSSVLVKTKTTPEIKNLDEGTSRGELFSDAFSATEASLANKSVLLFDDIFRSGETLAAVTKVLKEQAKASKVYVLTVTKTRTRR